ncbi:MAG: HAMP domain-containing protein [Desulfobacteraceae bacterium]|nr:HAMP domain-containing protein [Desulfobacteraceae bacterium]
MIQQWKNLNLRMKFALGFGMVLFLLLVVAGWSITGISDIVHNAGQVISGNQLSGMLADKEVDHLNWVNQVNALLTDKNVTNLSVETDDHKCGFGKWLYGEERSRAEALVTSLSPLLKEIEVPHRHLHESAIAIGKHFKQADTHLPAILSQRIIDHLNWAAKIRDTFLSEKDQLNVQTDPMLCALGKWLQSDEARNAYNGGDKEFKSAWQSMIAKHEALHASAKLLQNTLVESPHQAFAQFEQTTLPLLAETVEQLEYLYERSEQDLKGMRMANTIYATETLPSLGQIQELLHLIRTEAKQHIMTDQQMLNAAVKTRNGVVLFGGVAIIAGMILSFTIANGIISPLRKGLNLAQAVAQGDLTQTITVEQSDETGVLADSLNRMSANLREMFENITGGVETLTSSSTELSAIAQQMAVGSEQSSGKAQVVLTAAEEMNVNRQAIASASEQTSSNMQIVATATEQMTSTISEIAGNTENGRKIAGEAVDQTKMTSTQINELGKAVEQIGKVTEAIAEISEQTNLLALNATIEAARAGDAGKGFAVVANEIKDLAKQTADATKDIGIQITNIQEKTGDTVGRIDQVSAVILDLSEIVTAVAAAMEEQSAAAREIASNIGHAAQGIEEVNKNVAESNTASDSITRDMEEVHQAVREMATGSAQVSTSAHDLSTLAEQLNQMMGKFNV